MSSSLVELSSSRRRRLPANSAPPLQGGSSASPRPRGNSGGGGAAAAEADAARILEGNDDEEEGAYEEDFEEDDGEEDVEISDDDDDDDVRGGRFGNELANYDLPDEAFDEPVQPSQCPSEMASLREGSETSSPAATQPLPPPALQTDRLPSPTSLRNSGAGGALPAAHPPPRPLSAIRSPSSASAGGPGAGPMSVTRGLSVGSRASRADSIASRGSRASSHAPSPRASRASAYNEPPAATRVSSYIHKQRRLSSIGFQRRGSAARAAEREDAPQRGELKRAKAASLMRQCVKKTFVKKDGRYITPTGKRVNIERFPWIGTSLLQLPAYGCPVAMMLYLEFIVEASLVFLMMGIALVPSWFDLVSRTAKRRQCRASLLEPATNATLEVLSGCGYDNGVEVRADLPDAWYDFYIAPSVGTCMEYAGGVNYTTSQVLDFVNDPFVDLDPSAEYCAGEATSIWLFWGLAFNTLLLLLFVLRMRRMQAKLENKYSRHMYTAADFAVLVEGLKVVEYQDKQPSGGKGGTRRGGGGGGSFHRRKSVMHELDLHELELRADLERLHFGEDVIDHIEFGRDCAKEIVQLRRVAELKARRQEVQFQLARLHEIGRKQKNTGHALANKHQGKVDSLKDELDSIELKLLRSKDTLEELRVEKHATTGHAFIVFQTTSKRDEFIELFQPKEATVVLPDVLAGSTKDLAAAAAAGGGGGGGGGGAPSTSTSKEPVGGSPPKPPFMAKVVTPAAEPAKLLSAGPDAKVKVQKAPEPSDIYWENLAAPPSDRRNRQLITTGAIALIIVTGTATLYGVRTYQVFQNQKASLWRDEGDDVARIATMLSLSLLSILITLAVNLIIKGITEWLTFKENHPNRSSYERSIFTKLMAAYFINTILVPLFVSLAHSYPNDRSMTQAWFETGGVVSQAALFMIASDIIVTNFMRFVHIPALFKRRILGQFAASQIKLNQLWAPPRFPIGVIYAETFRSLAMGMVYAPLYPPAFFFTAIALCTSFYSTKYAISRWYMTPAQVDGQLMTRMRKACLFLVLAMVLVEIFTVIELYRVQSGSHMTPAIAAIIFSFFLWVCTILFGSLFSRLRFFSTSFGDEDGGKMSGFFGIEEMRYDKVSLKLRYDIERYECPAASAKKSTNHLLETAFRQGFNGGYVEEGVANELSTVTETEANNSANANAGSASSSSSSSSTATSSSSPEAIEEGAVEEEVVDVGDDFFQPVRPAAFVQDDEDLDRLSRSGGSCPSTSSSTANTPNLRASFSGWMVGNPPSVAQSESRSLGGVSSSSSGGGGGGLYEEEDLSNDPVIFYLDGALEMLNDVMVDLGGKPIEKRIDLDPLQAEIIDDAQQAAAALAAAPLPPHPPPASSGGGGGGASASGSGSSPALVRLAPSDDNKQAKRKLRRKGPPPQMPPFFDEV